MTENHNSVLNGMPIKTCGINDEHLLVNFSHADSDSFSTASLIYYPLEDNSLSPVGMMLGMNHSDELYCCPVISC